MTPVTVAAAGTAPLRRTSGHLDALDGVRGFAVLLVFCVHAAGNAAAIALGLDFGRMQFAAIDPLGARVLFWLHASHHGVFLFFVLSGFLIGRMWWPRPTLPYATFAWRRTLRVYPAFLLSFAGSLAFAHASGTWVPPDAPRLLANALFLNGAPGSGVVPFNIVTWSLFYEMTFYFAFPALALLALAAGRRGGAVLWAGGIAVPIAAVALGADAMVLCWALLFAGVALAVHEASLRAFVARVPALVVVAAYLAVTSSALVASVPALVALPAFGAAAVLLIAKGMAPGNAVAWVFTRAPLRALGRISYSFYLVHWMLVVLVARAVTGHVDALGPLGTTLAIFAGGFAVSALAATALWWAAERPYFAWVGRNATAPARG